MPAYLVAAVLLTITPGLDTALVLRTAAVEGPKRAALAAIGIIAGCLVWGAAVALGLGALLAASSLAFTALKWAGAAYLVWLGLEPDPQASRDRSSTSNGRRGQAPRSNGDFTWLRRGLLTNLLNPKVGVFTTSRSCRSSCRPGRPGRGHFIFLLAAIHGVAEQASGFGLPDRAPRGPSPAR